MEHLTEILTYLLQRQENGDDAAHGAERQQYQEDQQKGFPLS